MSRAGAARQKEKGLPSARRRRALPPSQDETPPLTNPDPLFLTTKEVADLLRVKERKVYDLAAEGAIPHRRLTGKLLFPRAALLAWADGPVAERPALLVGSHDPLLDWAVRESGAGLALLTEGSFDGLSRFLRDEAVVAGMHIPESGGWNVETVAENAPRDAVLLGFATRARGVILSQDLSGASALADLKTRRIAHRPDTTGSARLWAQLCAADGLSAQDFRHAGTAHTESDAAAMVASDEADATLGLASMAQRFSLPFLPLVQERFDLLVCRRGYFEPPLQKLMGFLKTAAFADKAAALEGYDVSETGTVRWSAP